MKYTVVYGSLADHQLPELMDAPKNRQQLTDASTTWIEYCSCDPTAREARINGWRSLSVPPVAITFQVFPDDCLVVVHSIRLHPDAEST